MSAPLMQLPTGGHAANTTAGKHVACSAVNRFLEESEGYESPWQELDASIVCCCPFFLEFSYWAVNHDSPSFAPGTIVEYCRKFMGVIEDKYKQAFPTFFFKIHDERFFSLSPDKLRNRPVINLSFLSGSLLTFFLSNRYILLVDLNLS